MEDVGKLKSDYCQLSHDHLEQEQETRLRQADQFITEVRQEQNLNIRWNKTK